MILPDEVSQIQNYKLKCVNKQGSLCFKSDIFDNLCNVYYWFGHKKVSAAMVTGYWLAGQ